MKFIHMSDLHLGKRVHEYSMLDDQRAVLREILSVVETEKPDGVLIAGDVYDRTVPPEEAVRMFDDFLVDLTNRGTQVYLISGNHDSEERVSFGGRLMEHQGVHIAPVYNGTITPWELSDEHGKVMIWPVSYLHPGQVRHFIRDEEKKAEVKTTQDAFETVLGQIETDPSVRNVIMVHQFVAGASVSDSEDQTVGGLDGISAGLFENFDYTALGHLHRPQNVAGKETVRYCGTPLAYSFSEVDHEKSLTVAELGEKGSTVIRTVPLHPVHPLKKVRGTFAELMTGCGNKDAYVEVTLTDEDDIPNAAARLKENYPLFMNMRYENSRTRMAGGDGSVVNMREEKPIDLFEKLFEQQNGRHMTEEMRAYMENMIESVWGGEQ